MRFAYADPPYPGQAKRWYGDHPDYAGEVDHGELISHLYGDYPDGWALSTSAAALPDVLRLFSTPVRIGIWNRPNAEPPGNRGRWHWTWEPVIISGGRKEGLTVRDLLTCPKPQGILAGQKPPMFTRWVWTLLGGIEGDVMDDLFPGSGAVGWELRQAVFM